MNQLPGYLDRYPAKMVARLAGELIDRYAMSSSQFLDPFCGSGALLQAAQTKGLRARGYDINPYAVLLTNVKLQGFDAGGARDLSTELITRSRMTLSKFPVIWNGKKYWFSAGTIEKYERLRAVARKMQLSRSREGRAVLLAYALSVRRCSRADQRSPKPFISESARTKRIGRHFDPYKEIESLLSQLAKVYGCPKVGAVSAKTIDVPMFKVPLADRHTISHIITSPPYINAQDYFRNFKLELYLLQDLLPFDINKMKKDCIGTERGALDGRLSLSDIRLHVTLVPSLADLQTAHPRQAKIVHRYLYDMGKSFDVMSELLERNGILVLVCGDNVVGGTAIDTWKILTDLLSLRGYQQFDQYGDQINRRYIPPKRFGHKALIKREVITAFRLK